MALQAVVVIVPQWLSTSGKSKNPADVSAGLRYTLETRGSGSNASEVSEGVQAKSKASFFLVLYTGCPERVWPGLELFF